MNEEKKQVYVPPKVEIMGDILELTRRDDYGASPVG